MNGIAMTIYFVCFFMAIKWHRPEAKSNIGRIKKSKMGRQE